MSLTWIPCEELLLRPRRPQLPQYEVRIKDPWNNDRLDYEVHASDAEDAEIAAVETFARDRDVNVFDVLECVTDVALISKFD